ncbi:hypothetical protein APE_0720 [Aeropyrum pernix ovoid virus 1]|uniref:Uncharacterized protein n=2 Tax=root TaxID=1 RepID=Q9YE50_AERPE|nr:hypothetical protein [Aeropyrum pernix]YP_009177654.1 hypothetical protein ASQ65_gp03 [Aeropyrum pernix ovoid virus 1]BAA79696.1 hypothetical protein APE_0720 [Aeropyrum pernix ovoid virus 1] [Aeropyrum pernix K1]CCD22144.1 TPA: hypothetical protein [Aeropyrum pernix ovoid virus 1]
MARSWVVAEAVALIEHYINVLIEIEKRLCPGSDACYSGYASIMAVDREKRSEAAERLREARKILEDARLGLERELTRAVLKELAEEKARELLDAAKQRLDGNGKLRVELESRG